MALFHRCNPGSHVANSKTSVWQKAKSFQFGFGFYETRVGGQILCPAVLSPAVANVAQKSKTFLFPFHHNLRESMRGEAYGRLCQRPQAWRGWISF